MKTKDVRQAFSALRARTGLSSEAFADLLGLPAGRSLADFEYPNGTYPHAHLPDELIERMLENLAGEGHPAISRDEIMQLSLIQEASAQNLLEQLLTPSLLADILVAFDRVVESNWRLSALGGVDVKARHTSILYKQVTTGAIDSARVGTVLQRKTDGSGRPQDTDPAMIGFWAKDTVSQAERETVLEELVAQALLVELIEAKVEASGTVAFLGHLLKTNYGGSCLRQLYSVDLDAILDQLTAIADAHQDPYAEEADNVVMLRDFRK